MTTIRASSLDDAADCPRRHAMRALREIQKRHEPRHLNPGIGSIVGTAVHAAAVLMWRGDPGRQAEATATAEFLATVQTGVTLDATTPSVHVARQQVTRCIRVYEQRVIPRIEPLLIEQRLEAQISPELTLSGSPDLVTRDRILRDLKDEIRRRPHINQIGAYALLLRSHGYRVKRAIIDHIMRQSESAMRRQQPHYEEISYDVGVVEASAHDVITRTASALTEYRQREADDDKRSYLAFRANPSSVLCSQKYCPAWGTAWCPEGAIAHGGNNV